MRKLLGWPNRDQTHPAAPCLASDATRPPPSPRHPVAARPPDGVPPSVTPWPPRRPAGVTPSGHPVSVTHRGSASTGHRGHGGARIGRALAHRGDEMPVGGGVLLPWLVELAVGAFFCPRRGHEEPRPERLADTPPARTSRPRACAVSTYPGQLRKLGLDGETGCGTGRRDPAPRVIDRALPTAAGTWSRASRAKHGALPDHPGTFAGSVPRPANRA
jgi:hypothetical protein